MSREDADPLGSTPGFGRTVDAFKELCVRDVMVRLRVGMPGHVVSFTPPVSAGPKSKPALVRVQPHFYSTLRLNSPGEIPPKLLAQGWLVKQEGDGWVASGPLPEIPNCPVAYIGTAGMIARGPLKPLESGWLFFSDRSLDKWTQLGGPVDPVFQDFHLLNDAVFVPGLRYGLNSKTLDITKHTIGSEDGSAGMEIDDVIPPALPNIMVKTVGSEATIDAATLIKLGVAAVQGVARLGDDVAPKAAMTAWALVVETAINTLIPGTFTPANSFATTVAGGNGVGSISSASTKVTAE